MRISSVTRGFSRRTSSVCHSEVTSAKISAFKAAGIGLGQGQTVQSFELLANAAAFEQHCAPRDFGGMRGENGNNFYFAQDLERLSGVDSGGVHAPESAAERAFQRRLLGMQLGGTPSPLAMVGFGKVGEFEINGECFGNPVGLIHRKAGNNLPRLVQ